MDIKEALTVLDEANSMQVSFIADVMVEIGKRAKSRSRSNYIGDTQTTISFLQLNGKEVAAISDFLEQVLNRVRGEEN